MGFWGHNKQSLQHRSSLVVERDENGDVGSVLECLGTTRSSMVGLDEVERALHTHRLEFDVVRHVVHECFCPIVGVAVGVAVVSSPPSICQFPMMFLFSFG